MDKPWLTEPDFKFFMSSELPCYIRRHNEFLCLLGYVGVPRTHPWYELGEDALVTPIDLTTAESPLTKLSYELNAHGGITFIGYIHSLVDLTEHAELMAYGRAWWFGFDCNHVFDRAPGIEALLLARGMEPPVFSSGDEYRDIDYVTGECARLAAQLAIVERRGVR